MWREDPRCFYCRVKTNLNYQKRDNHLLATIDHVVPKSKGGANNINNYVLACFGCNTAKGSLSQEQFIECLKTGTVPKRTSLKQLTINPPDKYTNPAYWNH